MQYLAYSVFAWTILTVCGKVGFDWKTARALAIGIVGSMPVARLVQMGSLEPPTCDRSSNPILRRRHGAVTGRGARCLRGYLH